MRGYNNVQVIGNLVRDPEGIQRGHNEGARFTVAANRQWKDRDGNKQEDVDFIPVVVWGNLAGPCLQYLNKGSGVFVTGRLKIGSYEKDGEKKLSVQVIAGHIQFLGGGNGGYLPQGEKRFAKSSGDALDAVMSKAKRGSFRDEPQFDGFFDDISHPEEDDEDIPF